MRLALKKSSPTPEANIFRCGTLPPLAFSPERISSKMSPSTALKSRFRSSRCSRNTRRLYQLSSRSAAMKASEP